jgi:hypothetical protein
MNTTKLLTVLFAALFLGIAFVSAMAAPGISFTQSVLTKNSNTSVITVTNPELDTNMSITLTVSDVDKFSLSSTSFTLLNNTSQKVNLSMISFPSAYGSYTYTVTANAVNASDPSINSTSSAQLTYIKGYCSAGSSRNDTKYFEISNLKDISSSNDWKWKLQDSVDIEVKVRYVNTQDNDDEIDAVIKILLWDSSENRAVDFDNQEDLERSITLSEGDSSIESFNLIVPSEDLEDSTGRYKLYVKVYEDGRESSFCRDNLGTDASPSADPADYFKNIEIQRESYDVVLKNLEVTTPTVCGGEVTVTGTLWNIGSNDEDRVLVRLYNNELKLNTNLTVLSLDSGSSKKVIMSFVVPQNAVEKVYDLSLINYFRYSKSTSESYREVSENPYLLPLKVEGCTPLETKSAVITAEYSSETPKAVIGSQVVIETTIKNTGNAAANYTIAVTGNSPWSTVTLDPTTITLNVNESKKVNLYLNINENEAEGNKEFTVTATSGVYSASQKVQITLEKGITTDRVLNHIKANWVIYTIVLVNLILIIAIIAVVRSIVKK